MGIGRRIREARESLGLTQSELAGLVGVTGSAIANYEKDTSHPKESVMYKLFDALNVDANYLFQDVANISKNTNNISFYEFDRIKKYRQLDNYGKHIIDLLLEEEYRRCTSTTSSALDVPVFEDAEYQDSLTEDLSSDKELPEEDLAAIEKAMEQLRIKKA